MKRILLIPGDGIGPEVGKGIANPMAAILAAAMMLRYRMEEGAPRSLVIGN